MMHSQRRNLALIFDIAAIVSCAVWTGIAWPQDQHLAPEGRGLVPKPAPMPPTLQGAPLPHPFEPDPSGGFSRTIFETDEGPNFKVVIRDFSFPPDRQTHTVTLPSAAFLHFLGEPGEIRIAKKRLTLTPVAR